MAKAEQPNILLICTDHWPDALTPAAGHPVIMTPTLAQLARCGTRYGNAYSTCPICIPARRSLMTGLTPRSHNDRTFKEHQPMPDVPKLAETFRGAGYQTYAVGKLHVYPQRDRIGFDDVLLDEQGRHHLGGGADDYELFLADQGYPGQAYATGMSHASFISRSWPLPEACHPTNWAASQMCRAIHRRDPRRPAFWYLSFSAPHPPLTPLQAYLDLYQDVPIDSPTVGNWSRDPRTRPWVCNYVNSNREFCDATEPEIAQARRAFYATCTHVDHQIRVVIGTLSEAGLLDNTVIVFTSDHGHMCGEHGLWTVMFMYEYISHIPLIIVPAARDQRLGGPGTVDNRLVEFADIHPTLLDLAGIAIPDTVEYRSLADDWQREYLYGEFDEGQMASRMIRQDRFKLIYYPAGNLTQLFDVAADPREAHDLADEPAHADTRAKLTRMLIDELYGSDRAWLQDGQLIGLPDAHRPEMNPDGILVSQRGIGFM